MSWISTPLLRVLCVLPGVLPLLQKYAAHVLPEDMKSSATPASNAAQNPPAEKAVADNKTDKKTA
jgi:hypothetical protein